MKLQTEKIKQNKTLIDLKISRKNISLFPTYMASDLLVATLASITVSSMLDRKLTISVTKIISIKKSTRVFGMSNSEVGRLRLDTIIFRLFLRIVVFWRLLKFVFNIKIQSMFEGVLEAFPNL